MKDKILSIFGKKKGFEEKKIEEYTKKDIKALIKELEEYKSESKTKMLEFFKTRRSIHKFELDKKVPWVDVYKIIEAGCGAPCAGNVQNYSFIVISNPAKKLELGHKFGQQCWISEASTLIIVLRNDYHLRAMFPDSGEKLCVQNVAAVIENMLMAAHIMGYGASWVAGNNNGAVKGLLGIPEGSYLEAIIPIGYPLEEPKVRKDEIVSKIFFEEFGNQIRKG